MAFTASSPATRCPRRRYVTGTRIRTWRVSWSAHPVDLQRGDLRMVCKQMNSTATCQRSSATWRIAKSRYWTPIRGESLRSTAVLSGTSSFPRIRSVHQAVYQNYQDLDPRRFVVLQLSPPWHIERDYLRSCLVPLEAWRRSQSGGHALLVVSIRVFWRHDSDHSGHTDL